MTPLMKSRLIAAVTFLAGLYFVLDFLLPEKVGSFEFGAYSEQILQGVAIVGTMAFGLGLINIFMVHGTRLVRGQKGWGNSFALLAGLLLMFAVQILDFRNSESDVRTWKPFSDYALFVEKTSREYPQVNVAGEQKASLLVTAVEARVTALKALQAESAVPDGERARRLTGLVDNGVTDMRAAVHDWYSAYRGQGVIKDTSERAAAALRQLAATASELIEMIDETRTTKKAHRLLYEGFFVPLGAAMFSLLAFYIANAAYRSFRLRSVEATVMMCAAVVVILGQIPHGPLYISERLPLIRLWLLQYINTPGNRAIYFGSAIAGFAMAFRMWLSLERSPLADDETAPRTTSTDGGTKGGR